MFLRARYFYSHDKMSSVWKYGIIFSTLLLSKENLIWENPRSERKVRKQVFLFLPQRCRVPKIRNSSNTERMFKMRDTDRKHDKLPLQLDSDKLECLW